MFSFSLSQKTQSGHDANFVVTDKSWCHDNSWFSVDANFVITGSTVDAITTSAATRDNKVGIITNGIFSGWTGS